MITHSQKQAELKLCLNTSLLMLWTALSCLCGPPGGSAAISLFPSENSLLPYNSNQTLTYTCVGNNTEDIIFLTVIVNGNKHQLQTPDLRERFATEYGINVTNDQQNSNVLNFTVNSFGWIPLLEKFRSPLKLVLCCQAFSHAPRNHNTIIVYGPLEEPKNVTFDTTLNKHLQVKWSGPDVPTGVNITYQVHMIDISTGVMYGVFNTSEEFIEIDIRGVCGEFNFTIIAYDEHGGLTSETHAAYNISSVVPNVSNIENSLNTIAKHRDKDISLLVTFNPATVCDEDHGVINYTLVVGGITSVTVPASAAVCAGDESDSICMGICISEVEVEQTVNYSITACTSLACGATEPFLIMLTPLHLTIPGPTMRYPEDLDPFPHTIICYVLGTILLACSLLTTLLSLSLCWYVSRKCRRKNNTRKECSKVTLRRESLLNLVPEQETTNNDNQLMTSYHRGSGMAANMAATADRFNATNQAEAVQVGVAQSGGDSVSIEVEDSTQDMTSGISNGGNPLQDSSEERQDGELSVLCVVTKDAVMWSSRMTPTSSIQTCINSSS